MTTPFTLPAPAPANDARVSVGGDMWSRDPGSVEAATRARDELVLTARGRVSPWLAGSES
jgi:hypothetical protein